MSIKLFTTDQFEMDEFRDIVGHVHQKAPPGYFPRVVHTVVYKSEAVGQPILREMEECITRRIEHIVGLLKEVTVRVNNLAREAEAKEKEVVAAHEAEVKAYMAQNVFLRFLFGIPPQPKTQIDTYVLNVARQELYQWTDEFVGLMLTLKALQQTSTEFGSVIEYRAGAAPLGYQLVTTPATITSPTPL